MDVAEPWSRGLHLTRREQEHAEAQPAREDGEGECEGDDGQEEGGRHARDGSGGLLHDFDCGEELAVQHDEDEGIDAADAREGEEACGIARGGGEREESASGAASGAASLREAKSRVRWPCSELMIHYHSTSSRLAA